MKERIREIYKEKSDAYLSVLEEFDKAGVEYVLLNLLVADDNPGDMDVLVCKPCRDIITQVLKRNGFDYYTRYAKGQYLWNKYLKGVGFVQFHIYESLCAFEKPYFPSELINRDLQNDVNFHFLVFLVESLCKLKLRGNQYEEYRNKSSKEEVVAYVKKANPALLDVVQYSIVCYEKNSIDPSKAQALLWNNRSVKKISSHLYKLLRRVAHLLKNNDIEVLFLGVDGAGKSTLVDGVNHIFSKGGYLAKKCYFGIRNSKLSRKNGSSERSDQVSDYEDRLIKQIPLNLPRMIKLVLMWLEYNVKYLRHITLSSFGVKTLFLIDRCYLDILLFYPYRIVEFLFLRFSLMPRRIVFLTGDMEELYNRKKEMSFSRYKQVYEFYDDILKKMRGMSSKHILVVDTTKEEANKSITTIADFIATDE